MKFKDILKDKPFLLAFGAQWFGLAGLYIFTGSATAVFIGFILLYFLYLKDMNRTLRIIAYPLLAMGFLAFLVLFVGMAAWVD